MATLDTNDKSDNKKIFNTLEKITIGAFVAVPATLAIYSKIEPKAYHDFICQIENTGTEWTYTVAIAGVCLLLLRGVYHYYTKN